MLLDASWGRAQIIYLFLLEVASILCAELEGGLGFFMAVILLKILVPMGNLGRAKPGHLKIYLNY